MGIPWFKVNNSNSFFCKFLICSIVLQFLDQRKQQQDRYESKMSKQMDLNYLRLTHFPILKKRTLVLFSLIERLFTWHSQLRFGSIFTPRYLILSIGYSLLLHSSIFKSTSNFFCLDIKMAISFFIMIEILFALNHLTRCLKSVLTSFSNFFDRVTHT